MIKWPNDPVDNQKAPIKVTEENLPSFNHAKYLKLTSCVRKEIY